jgi:hypothetical protein
MKRRKECRGDARKTTNRIVKSQRRFCNIEAEKMAEHYAQNWEVTPTYNEDEEILFIKDKKEKNLKITEEDAKRYLYDHEAIINILRYKELVSAPGNDKLTYGILIADRDGCNKAISNIIRAMLDMEHCPKSWKNAKTIILPKPCLESEKDEPSNWRPISLTSVIYRIIMNQFSNFLQDESNFDEIADKGQKGFIKNIEGCAEHAATINYLIGYENTHKKSLFVATLEFEMLLVLSLTSYLTRI